MSLETRNSVRILGNPDGRTLVFSHGFGCGQEAWRDVVPYFTDDYRVVLFDHVGSGHSDATAYDPGKYSSLEGYASDINELFDELDLTDAVFIGHSVSAMMGVIASVSDPTRFGALVLVGPSPRYVNDGAYSGGFEQRDIDGMLEALDLNHMGWSAQMAPVITGNPDRPELGERLTDSFCATDPAVARQFARVTFLSDTRDELARVSVPTLVIQNSDDIIAPDAVGEFVAAQIPNSTLVKLESTGHMPHFSGPRELAEVIRAYLT